jgi:hypothetical protein
MTVNNSANKTVVAGNGVQTVFGFGFIAVAAGDISVILTDSSGNETTLAPALYTLALNPQLPGQLWSIGGTVTYPLTGSPAPTGSTLTIVRTLSLTQLVSISNQGNAFPSAIEQAIDLIEMQLQQVYELFQRALVAPVVDPSAPLPLPPAAQRANHALLFDASGNPVAGAIPASGFISTAMQSVVSAASLAAGRAAFGLGGMATEGIGAGLQDDGSGNARVLPPLIEVATNQNIVAANHTSRYAAVGTLTFTLPRANTTLFNGFYIDVFALTGAITFAVDSHDAFFGQSSGASLTIPSGSFARITTDAITSAVWYADVSAVRVTTNFIGMGSSGTYTPSPGLLFAIIEGVGAGGGGGSVPAYTGAEDGGGGGGGGYAKVILSAAQIGAPQGVTIGTGGVGGSAGGDGGGGGGTSFGLFLAAQGGSGGHAATGAGGPGQGGAAGIGSAGQALLPGQDGSPGYFSGSTTSRASGGQGGSSHLGFGGIGPGAVGSGSSNSGNPGKSYGGGGQGGSTSNGAAANGGNGAPGVLFITEFLYVI